MQQTLSRLTVTLILSLFLFPAIAVAATSQIGPRTNYSAAEIAAAVRSSSLTDSLKQHADQMGQLGIFESSGNAGIYNGSCCTGIFQVNEGNLANFGYTPEQYANLPLQQQVNVWAELTNQGANTAVVKKLQSMGTFAGQQVDGAFIMACIQLGTGNCQKMVGSGTCSGFADKNGTTICKMANAMRGQIDSSKQVSDPFGNITGDKQNADLFTKSDLQVQECWSCEAVARVIEVNAQIGPLLIDKLGTAAAGLMAIIFSLVLVLLVMMRLFWISSGSPSWNSLFWLVLRFAFVITLILSGSLYNDFVRPYVFLPSMTIGGELGAKFAALGNSAFKNRPSQGACRYDRIRATDAEVVQAGEAVVNLVCAVHLTVNEGIKQAAMPASAVRSQDSSVRSIAVSAVLSVFSLFVQVSFWFALLTFALQVVEALIRMGFFIAFAPFLAYAWVYKKTRASFVTAVTSFFYGGMLLAFSGLLSAVMLFVISNGMKQAGSPSTLSGSLEYIGQTVYFLVYSIASAGMAASLMRAAPSFAAAMTNYVGGQARNSIAAAGVAGITHGVRVASAIGGTAMFVGGGVAGNGLGRLYAARKSFLDGLEKAKPPSTPGAPNVPKGTSSIESVRAFSAGP